MATVNPEHLLSFARIARLGSISAAAESLHRSQPAISLQMRLLTEAIGEPLYQRHRLGVQLTPTGEALLPHAQALERALAGAERVGLKVRGAQIGQIAVGASLTIATYLLPRLLARFRQLHPHLDLQLLAHNSTDILDLLREGTVEVALVETPVDTELPEFEQHVIATDEVVLVTTPDHPLTAAADLKPADLNGLKVVSREAGSGTRHVSELALARFGVTIHTTVVTSSIEATKESVLQGLGPGFISRLAVERELAAGLLKIIPVRDLEMQRPLILLHPPAEVCSRASRALLEFLKSSGV